MPFMLKESDRALTREITASSAVAHRDNGRHPLNNARMLQWCIDELRKSDLIEVPESVTVRLCRLRQRNTAGCHRTFNEHDHLIELDARRIQDHSRLNYESYKAVECLCHELVHAEQQHQGRFKTIYDKEVYMWRTFYGDQEYMKPRNMMEYLQLPWEAEAYARQGMLSEFLWDQIAENGRNMFT